MKGIPDKSIDMVLTSPLMIIYEITKDILFNFEGIAKNILSIKRWWVCVFGWLEMPQLKEVKRNIF